MVELIRPVTPNRLSMFDRALVGPALIDSVRKLDPRVQWRNPVLLANFAEALAEGRSKAQAAALRGLKRTVSAKKLAEASDRSRVSRVRADQLRKGDIVLIEADDYIPVQFA
jgi:K+-transporting ATPase ATPase B chain